MPKRGDLLLPFLSYAVNNDKINDAFKICKKNSKRNRGILYLIKANQIFEPIRVK